jgi:uncharacterized delta-60 repeat protein
VVWLLPVRALLGWQLGMGDPAQARAGDLDPSFGTDGNVATEFSGHDAASALVVQGDKLVAAGGTRSSRAAGGPGAFALARYNADGSLDPSFGTGGKVTTDFGGTASARALVVQGDRLVAAGSVFLGAGVVIALARYNADGGLDPSFGTGGKVTTDFGVGSGEARALVVHGDKLVAAGFTRTVGIFTGTRGDFALARYHANGSLDSSFGTGGKVATGFTGQESGASALVVQGDKLVAAGFTDSGTSSRFALARYRGH